MELDSIIISPCKWNFTLQGKKKHIPHKKLEYIVTRVDYELIPDETIFSNICSYIDSIVWRTSEQVRIV